MTRKTHPYSLGRTLLVGLATAVAFALLSLFFLYMQAQETQHRLAGEVVSVTTDSARIQDAHGEITVLVVSADAELRDIASFREMEIGQHVMMRGSFVDDGTFAVDRMRPLTDGPAE